MVVARPTDSIERELRYIGLFANRNNRTVSAGSDSTIFARLAAQTLGSFSSDKSLPTTWGNGRIS